MRPNAGKPGGQRRGEEAAAKAAAAPANEAAPARSAVDLESLNAEYNQLRDELFRSRAKAHLIGDALFKTRIVARFKYEARDAAGRGWRSYGNELWEFDEHGLMTRREASINGVPIEERQRRIHGPRPEADRGRSFPLE